jgi:hypothetical protein
MRQESTNPGHACVSQRQAFGVEVIEMQQQRGDQSLGCGHGPEQR